MEPSARAPRRATVSEPPLELFADRGTYAGLLVLMVVFLGAAVILASERPGLAFAFGVVGSIGAFGCIRATLSRRPRIVIDEHGIHDNMHGPAVIPWQDLTGVEIGGDGEAYLYMRDPSRTLGRFGWRSLLMSPQLTWPRERRQQRQGPRGLCIRLGGLAAGRDLAAAQFEWAVETFGPPDLLWSDGMSPARAAIAARRTGRAAKSRGGEPPPILPG